MPSPLRIFPDVEKNKQALVDIDDIVWDESLDNHIKASRIRKIIASLTEAPHA